MELTNPLAAQLAQFKKDFDMLIKRDEARDERDHARDVVFCARVTKNEDAAGMEQRSAVKKDVVQRFNPTSFQASGSGTQTTSFATAGGTPSGTSLPTSPAAELLDEQGRCSTASSVTPVTPAPNDAVATSRVAWQQAREVQWERGLAQQGAGTSAGTAVPASPQLEAVRV
jgi:hypothetical protein